MKKGIKSALAIGLTAQMLTAAGPTVRDTALLGSLNSGPAFPNDDFESYTAAAAANGLNGGLNWSGPYVDSALPTGIQARDDVEPYSDAAALSGLNSGTGWGGAFADRDTPSLIKAWDSMESYSDTTALNGLSGHSSVFTWGGAFIDR